MADAANDGYFVPEHLCLHPCDDTQQGVPFRIGRLENGAREISRKMNDVLARVACDFKDCANRW
jgi:hypothetical protein